MLFRSTLIDPQFRENEQGDQGGQGGQQGQKEPVLPPIAELQLLSRLQTEALRSTAEASEGGEPAMVEAARQDAIKMQSELAKRSKILLEKLSAKQGMGQ